MLCRAGFDSNVAESIPMVFPSMRSVVARSCRIYMKTVR
jgi:hypothetical protein